MPSLRAGWLLLSLPVLLATGCARELGRPPEGVGELSVSTVVDVPTGDPVMLMGHTFVERLVGREPVSLAQVMTKDAETLLTERGFRIVPLEGTTAPVLEMTVSHWQPDDPARRWVLVSVEARLLDGPGGEVRWTYRRERWMVPTRDAPDALRAQRRAARAVVADVLAGWRPAVAQR